MRIQQIKYGNIENYNEKFEQLLTELVIEMRTDLYGKREREFPNIYLLGGYLKKNNNYWGQLL